MLAPFSQARCDRKCFFLFSDSRGTAAEEGKEARVSQVFKHKGQGGEGQTGVC